MANTERTRQVENVLNARYAAEDAEIARLQAEMNFHPDASPFWDTPKGQETLEAAASYGIKATNTNKERCEIYAAAKQNAAYSDGRRYV